MEGENMRPAKYIAAFVITSLIFLFGVSLGSNISQEELTAIEMDVLKVRQEQEATELVMALRMEDSMALCKMPLEKLTASRGKMGKSLQRLEAELGKLHPRVIDQKDQYYLIQAREYLLVKRMEIACEKSYPTILYFYSNFADCTKCEAQGFILDEIHFDGNVPVQTYSFDIHANNTIVTALNDQYGIKTAPSMVIGGATYAGFLEKDQVMELIRVE